MVIGSKGAFGWFLACSRVPVSMVILLKSVTGNPVIILLFMNVVLFIPGTFMDMPPLIVITTPIFLPVAVALGVGKIRVWQAMRTICPFHGAASATLMLVIHIPRQSLWLPSLFH